jgi:hypothetical protein
VVELMPPPPPAEPPRPVVRDYNWPNADPNAGAAFSLAGKDGTTRQAVAVWVQDNQVRYTTEGGKTAVMAADAIDCGATEQLNARNHLRLALPGCAASR